MCVPGSSLYIIINDGLNTWFTFDITRFNPSYPSFVFLSFIYFYYIIFKYWNIYVELFHIPGLSREDLTSIQW